MHQTGLITDQSQNSENSQLSVDIMMVSRPVLNLPMLLTQLCCHTCISVVQYNAPTLPSFIFNNVTYLILLTAKFQDS